MTDAYNKIQDRLFDGIKIDVDGKIDHAAAREWAEREILQLYEALEWLTYLAHGVGKAGGSPEPGEHIEAATAGKAALAKARGESPGPHGPEGS